MLPNWQEELLQSAGIDFDRRNDGFLQYGIVPHKVNEGAGVEFHEKMETGTTLRALQHRHLHLAYWETPYYESAIRQMLPDRPEAGQVAVDLGCGDGRFTGLLIEAGYQKVVAVDCNFNSLASLEAHAREHGFRDKLLIIQSGADALCLQPDSVDAAIAIGVFYYLNEEFERGLQNTRQFLKPGGTLIASEPDLEGAALKALLFEGINDFVEVFKDRRFTETNRGEKTKFRVFSRSEITEIYSRNGFSVRSSHGLSIFPSLLRIGMLRGHYSEQDIADSESVLRSAFDSLNDDGCSHKHILWQLVKEGKGAGL